MIPDAAVDMPIHYTYMVSGDTVVAACTASNRFDTRFRSSSTRADVTCPECLAHTESAK